MRRYDDKGNVTDKFVMEPCGEHSMVQVEAGQWHSLEVLEEGTVVFEAKDGAWEEEDINRQRAQWYDLPEPIDVIFEYDIDSTPEELDCYCREALA